MTERAIKLVGGTPGLPQKITKRATYFIGAYGKNGRLKAVKIGLCTLGKHERRLKQLQTASRETLPLGRDRGREPRAQMAQSVSRVSFEGRMVQARHASFADDRGPQEGAGPCGAR